jgi:hypothetical protein
MESVDGDATAEVVIITEAGPDGATADGSVSERVEDVARAAAMVAVRGADVVAARRQPDVRQAVLDLGALAIVATAFVTAFAFGNWAAFSALTTAVSDWFAALILAAIWLAVAVLLGAFRLRGDRSVPRDWRRFLAKDAAETLPERQQALDEAEQTLRVRVDELADAIAGAAQERIAAAVLPLAGGMVEAGEEMVDATDEVIDAADEITDVIEERVPGGVVVNRAVDVVLVPGRFGVRAARTVLKLRPNTK